MIYVSDAWKKAHKQMILPESFVEILMDLVNEDVKLNGYAVGVNEAAFSNSGGLINNTDYGATTKYAFLEQNSWSLDGSRDVVSDIGAYHPPGYASLNDDGAEVQFTMLSAQAAEIPGLTIIWSSEFDSYATKFSVEVKSGNAVVASTVVNNNASATTFVDLPFSNFDSVVVTVLEWSHPDQRSRIDSVMFGHHIVVTKDSIISYSHEQSGSPLGTELSKNEIEFEVDNSDGRWNPLNPSGSAKYLSERQKVTVRYGLDTGSGIEWIPAGVFYLSEWRAPSNGITATFVARDAIDFMLNETYSRPYVEAVTVDVARVYLTKDSAIYTYSDEHLATTLPAGAKVKVYEKTVWYQDGYGSNYDDPGIVVYRIDEGWLVDTYLQITPVTLFSDISTAMMNSLPADVNRWVNDEISFGVRSDIAIEESPTAEFIQKGLATYGATIWQSHDGTLNATNPMIGAQLSDYAISADLSYKHPEVELTKPLRNVNVVQHYDYGFEPTTVAYEVTPSGEDITVDCPYMWYYETARRDALAAKYINWWKHREIVSGEFRADPRLELFDVVSVETRYGVLSPVMITYVKYSYSGSFRGIYEGKVIAVEEV